MCHLPLDNRTSAIISRCETFSAKYLVPLQVIDYRSVNRLLLHCLDIHNVVVAPKVRVLTKLPTVKNALHFLIPNAPLQIGPSLYLLLYSCFLSFT